MGWRTIIDARNCPGTADVVVGYWICGSETYAELCYYDWTAKEWYSASPSTRGDPVTEPDYWTELPK